MPLFNNRQTIDPGKMETLVSGAKQYIGSSASIPRDAVKYSNRDPVVMFSSRVEVYDAHEVSRNLRKVMEEDSGPVPEDVFKGNVNESFSGALIRYIREKDLKDSAVYKAAGVDRRLFSKIISNDDYRPSKDTCIALALALQLDLEDANDLLSRAGYSLSHSIKRDIVIEYCIREEEYSLMYVNELLYRLDLPMLKD